MNAGTHVLIAANPKSGAASNQQKVTELCESLRAAGLTCETSSSLSHIQTESRRLNDHGMLRAVVAAGGDGTVDALVNLLDPAIRILIFPLGTENLLAKHWGLTNDVRSACRTIQHGVPVSMDVGSANGKLFLVMLSCGFDAEVVRQMHAVRRGHINRWSYTGPILRALGKYRFPQISVKGIGQDDVEVDLGTTAWAFLFNVPRYAANLQFCPQANPTDGLLDLCLFRSPDTSTRFVHLGPPPRCRELHETHRA